MNLGPGIGFYKISPGRVKFFLEISWVDLVTFLLDRTKKIFFQKNFCGSPTFQGRIGTDLTRPMFWVEILFRLGHVFMCWS